MLQLSEFFDHEGSRLHEHMHWWQARRTVLLGTKGSAERGQIKDMRVDGEGNADILNFKSGRGEG
jgi:hypothetical protein